MQDYREKIGANRARLDHADPEFWRSVNQRYEALHPGGNCSAHPADLRRLQGDVAAWAEKLITRKDWSDEKHFATYEAAMAWAGLLDCEINNQLIAAQAMGVNFGEPTGSNTWVNAATGAPVRVLAPSDRLSDRAPRGDEPTVGGLVAALLTGPKTPAIRAALSEGTDSAGGFSIPTTVLPQFIDRLRARTQFIQAGAQTVMLEGMKTRIMRIVADPVPTWRAENAAVAESDPTFDAIDLAPKSLAVLVKVSMELLQDSVNVAAALEQALIGALSVELDRAALFGTGTLQPLGLFNQPGINTFSMGANGAAPTNYDPLIDALYELELDNADAPTAAIWHPRTARTLRKLKDTTNQPLQPLPAIRDLPLLASTSVPITQTQGTSTDCSTILMGDFTRALLGIRQELRIQVLQERFADNLQVGFLAHLRADVAFERADAFCRITGVRP
jgi:HK97 family phage major capsid protein